MEIDWVSTVSGLVSGLISGGTIVAVFITYFGQKWIDGRFDKSRIKLEHINQGEIERLRGVIQGYIDHQTRLNTQEFIALTETYHAMHEAVIDARSALAVFIQPDSIVGVKDHVKRYVMETNGLIDIEIEHVLEKSTEFEMESEFHSILRRRKLQKALINCQKFGDALTKNSIFLPIEVCNEFQEIRKLTWEALFERYQNERIPGLQSQSDLQNRFHKSIVKSLENAEINIRSMIRERHLDGSSAVNLTGA